MSDKKCFEIRDRVAVVRIDNPPVNALTTGVPEGIARAVESAQSDASVRAIVVIGAGRTFAAGADIREFERFAKGEGPNPEFHRWLNLIEDSAKPVVMAIHGQALGAGLELAMAGHYRVATADAQVGQPEVKIGLIPGAAGTVRLPRLVGVEKAAEMCALGEALRATDALEVGLIDRVVEGDLLQGAIAFSRGLTTVRRTRDLPVHGAVASDLRRRVHPKLEAPLAAIEAIAKTSVLNFEDGCRVEAEIFQRCLRSPQSKALIHVFFAERAAKKTPGFEAVRVQVGERMSRMLAEFGKAENEETRDRCLSALANEGARVLEEGLVTRASDIDVICIGYGFPAYLGGPIFYAATASAS